MYVFAFQNMQSYFHVPYLFQKPMRICPFCDEWQTHLKRHIVRRHPSEEQVIEALKLPVKDQMRAFASMRKKGIYQQNVILAEQREELIRERRQGSSITLMCSGCRGFYDKKNIFKHKRLCSKSESENPIGVNIHKASENALGLELSQEFMEQVVDRFRNDEVGHLCKSDFLILLLGKKSWAKSVKKERKVTMNEMRMFGHLILAFREQSGIDNASGIDILDISKFESLEKAILQLSGNSENTKDGLRVRLGFLLKHAAKVLRGYFITQGKFTEEKAIVRFLNVLQLQWDFIFYNAQVACEARREGLRKPCAMPIKDDVDTLRRFTISEMNSMLDEPYDFWDDALFVKLRNLIVCRLTLFNARRSGEPARLTLREWTDAIRDAWIDPEMKEQIEDPQERLLVKDMKLAYQAGKGSRKLVPVLFPKDTLEPITKLLVERNNCSIHPENVYLFPNTKNSLDHASGYHCLKSAVKQVPNLIKPNLLIADKFRHQVSTIFASFELPTQQQHSFIRHMGHSESINRNVYQCPMALQEITKVGKLLSKIDIRASETVNEAAHGMRNPEGNQQSSSACEALETLVDQNTPVNEESETMDNQPPCEESGKELKPKKSIRTYTRWSSEDTRIVKDYFKKYITDTETTGSLPPKSEVMLFLSKNEILQGHENKYMLVRTKIFNEKKKFRFSFKAH